MREDKSGEGQAGVAIPTIIAQVVTEDQPASGDGDDDLSTAIWFVPFRLIAPSVLAFRKNLSAMEPKGNARPKARHRVKSGLIPNSLETTWNKKAADTKIEVDAISEIAASVKYCARVILWLLFAKAKYLILKCRGAITMPR